MIPVGVSMFICVHYYHSCSNDPCWHEQDYIQPPYHHSIYCRHRNNGPHLCEDVRLYRDGNLNPSVCQPNLMWYHSNPKMILPSSAHALVGQFTLSRQEQIQTVMQSWAHNFCLTCQQLSWKCKKLICPTKDNQQWFLVIIRRKWLPWEFCTWILFLEWQRFTCFWIYFLVNKHIYV